MDLSAAALAAKLRVAHFENQCFGGLNVRLRAAEARARILASPQVYRRALWRHWFEALPLLVWDDAMRSCRAQGVTCFRVEQVIAGEAIRPWARAVAVRVRGRFQCSAMRLFRGAACIRSPGPHEGPLGTMEIARIPACRRREGSQAFAAAARLNATTCLRRRLQHDVEPMDNRAQIPEIWEMRVWVLCISRRQHRALRVLCSGSTGSTKAFAPPIAGAAFCSGGLRLDGHRATPDAARDGPHTDGTLKLCHLHGVQHGVSQPGDDAGDCGGDDSPGHTAGRPGPPFV